MPRKSKNGIQPIGVGLTAKQMKRRKPINADMLRVIEPLTENQKKLSKIRKILHNQEMYQR